MTPCSHPATIFDKFVTTGGTGRVVKARLAVGMGMGMWVLIDRGLNPVVGLTAGPRAFSPVTDLRAAAARAVYGLAGRAAPRRRRPRLNPSDL